MSDEGEAMTVSAAELSELDVVRDAHVGALNAGDVDAWVACFDPDGVQMPPNEPANVGIDRIRAWSQAFLSAFHVEFSVAPAYVEVAADRAIERGAWEIALLPRGGGEPMRDAGKYLTTYRRHANGSWLMVNDIWNSDGS
jgi:ketosteroid isomerase-like protein